MSSRRTLNLLLSVLALGSIVHIAFAQARTDSGARREERYFPSGERSSSALMVERTVPVEVRRGEEIAYDLRVTNLSRLPLPEFTLTETFPPAFRVKSITPEPTRQGAGAVSWTYANAGGAASSTIRIVGVAERIEELKFCSSVVFTGSSCVTTRVVEPRLAIQKTMPADALVCDDIPIRIVVSNTGSGVASGVRITDNLPAGLTTREGNTAVSFDVGELAAGQSREATFVTRAARGGEYRNTARATEAGGLSVEASAAVMVRQPVLTVTKTGPAVRFAGRSASFDIAVTNRGDAPATDVVLTDAIPPGTDVVGVESDGRLAGGQMTWALGTIPPGASKTAHITLKATQIGRFTNQAFARAYCAEAAGSATVEVRGIPAILLEVIDVADPIEVGASETYEIEVTNQGSAADSNITVEATLPSELEYVSASGPTTGTLAGNVVRFAPLPTLAPKAKVVYKVVGKGLKVGDVRFKVSMKSDQTITAVEESESTHIYE